jgi:hypothetical protein
MEQKNDQILYNSFMGVLGLKIGLMEYVFSLHQNLEKGLLKICAFIDAWS